MTGCKDKCSIRNSERDAIIESVITIQINTETEFTQNQKYHIETGIYGAGRKIIFVRSIKLIVLIA